MFDLEELRNAVEAEQYLASNCPFSCLCRITLLLLTSYLYPPCLNSAETGTMSEELKITKLFHLNEDRTGVEKRNGFNYVVA